MFLLALLGVVVFAADFPGPARGDYAVTQCVPNSAAYTDAAIVQFGPYSIWPSNECGSDHGLRLDTGPSTGWTANGSGLAWRFAAPLATTFTTARARVHYGDDKGFAAASFSDGAPPFTVFATCQTPSSCWTQAAANNAAVFEIRLQCFKSPNCHSDWAYAWATDFAATMHDKTLPHISASGPLVSGGLISGVQDLETNLTDSGGGARLVNVYVNGIFSRGADFCAPNSNGSYMALKPCPDSKSQPLIVDTERDPGWANGPNDVSICAVDVGGNVSSPCVRRTVQVDNSCPGSGGVVAAGLDAGADIGGSLRQRASITSSTRPVVRGRLEDGAGNPVVGATICTYETIDLPDASRQLVSTATTQGNGRFAARLDSGPSRRVDLIYRYNDRSLSNRVQLDSRVVPSLAILEKRLENGESARFKGQVPGPNADSRAVALQARVGRKWRTFKQLRTDSDGRFRGRYRFTQTRGRVQYVFRALVKRQGGYPYDPGSSPRRKLVVRG
jgi:hypothetical protein